ncbi:hypothetical protein BD779DRAFT_1682142 [Infundibulicybe gibba]|nr:hypothetical protein BD779DRAFT_1682142 [Infundibulicybe gibba]
MSLICCSPTCNKPSRYNDAGNSFCSIECQLDLINEKIPSYRPILRVPPQPHPLIRQNMHEYRDRHAAILGELGASIAGFGAPVQNLKSLVVYLQCSAENENHFRVAGLQRIDCMRGVRTFGLYGQLPTIVRLTSSAIMAFFVFMSSDASFHFIFSTFPMTPTTTAAINGYSITTGVEELQDGERRHLDLGA